MSKEKNKEKSRKLAFYKGKRKKGLSNEEIQKLWKEKNNLVEGMNEGTEMQKV